MSAAAVLLGIAAGDAAGWPAARHRALTLPPWTRRLARELDAFAEEHALTTLPVPFALNRPPAPLALGPSDDAEWAAFTALAVRGPLPTGAARTTAGAVPEGTDSGTVPAGAAPTDAARTGAGPGGAYPGGTASDSVFDSVPGGTTAPRTGGTAGSCGVDPAGSRAGDPAGRQVEGTAGRAAIIARIEAAWRALAARERPVPARVSVRAALRNLAAGIDPPASGHDNPHYFDDAACVRGAVLGCLYPGDPAAAAGLAGAEAHISNDEDGVHGARAVAAAVAVALGSPGAGSPGDPARAAAAVDAALAELPAATEIGRQARAAVSAARGATPFELIPGYDHDLIDHVYSYGVAAAETVPVALGLTLAAHGDPAAAIPAAACLARTADSAPALTGALTGALHGAQAFGGWAGRCATLAGCVFPELAGVDIREVAALLTPACGEDNGEDEMTW